MDDKTQIIELGGPSKVAQLLGFDKKGGAQRVQNWMRRGIPPKVKLQYPRIFLKRVAKPKDGINEPAKSHPAA